MDAVYVKNKTRKRKLKNYKVKKGVLHLFSFETPTIIFINNLKFT